MSNNLFFLSNGRAIEMSEHLYEKEDRLQLLIERNPKLLLRNPSSEDEKLLLIEREFSIQESEDSGNSYSLDHLFVDQSGTPVLVEVKRSTDTRIRREVIAQMLDYASRASTWDVNQLRSMFREHNPDNEILEQYDTDDFWERVGTCLKAEHIKLVFAADSIPDTLRTLIEFMNRSMSDIEVYGVEIHQYKTDEATLLSTSVVGENQQKQRATIARSGIEWTAENIASYLLEKSNGDVIPILGALQDFSESIGYSCVYGRGAKTPTITFKFGGYQVFRVTGWSKKALGDICTVEFCIRDLLSFSPFAGWDESKLLSILSDMPGRERALSENLMWHTSDYLYINLRTFADEANFSYFKDGIKLVCEALSGAEI